MYAIYADLWNVLALISLQNYLCRKRRPSWKWPPSWIFAWLTYFLKKWSSVSICANFGTCNHIWTTSLKWPLICSYYTGLHSLLWALSSDLYGSRAFVGSKDPLINSLWYFIRYSVVQWALMVSKEPHESFWAVSQWPQWVEGFRGLKRDPFTLLGTSLGIPWGRGASEVSEKPHVYFWHFLRNPNGLRISLGSKEAHTPSRPLGISLGTHEIVWPRWPQRSPIGPCCTAFNDQSTNSCLEPQRLQPIS